MVLIAGDVFNLWIREDSAMVLINTGDEKRCIPAHLHGKEEAVLIDRLSRFEKGDYIQIRGYARPWSQKVADKWQKHLEIRITEIPSEPPKREEKPNVPAGWGGATDDDIPF